MSSNYSKSEEELSEDRLKIRELELHTQYQIQSLTDSFSNLKQFFDNFKGAVDITLEAMKGRVEDMRMTVESFIDRQEKRNEKVWNRLNLITVLVVLQLFDVKVDIVDLGTQFMTRFIGV